MSPAPRFVGFRKQLRFSRRPFARRCAMRSERHDRFKQPLSHARLDIITSLLTIDLTIIFLRFLHRGLLHDRHFLCFTHSISWHYVRSFFARLRFKIDAPFFFLHQLMKMHPRHAVKEASAWADLCYRDLPFTGSHARKKRSAPGIITAFH